ncbi:MAG: carbohydrate kinase [Geminicoccaceae bacterium]|nr:carbohydrate kinase [Geminicoccaceae bacterium]
MALAREVLIGLEAGTTMTVAVAFTQDGDELARATVDHPIACAADGCAEQEPGEAWQRAAAAVRQLALRVAYLERRAIALALTGPGGGAWLVDEDGDAVLPAILPVDRRAEAIACRWRRAGIARAVAQITGCPIGPSSQSAQLAWLAENRPAALDHAASVFCGKDWLYFCCTGERASEPTAALAAFGSLMTGVYDEDVLDRLGLADAARLLPEIGAGPREPGALAGVAAAAFGLTAGTPVVLGPVDQIAATLAAGLGGASELGCTTPGARGCHVRSRHDLPDLPRGDREITVLRHAGSWFGIAHPSAGIDPDWLVGMAEQLVADAGLIGVPRSELMAILEQRAAAAAAGRLRYLPGKTASAAGTSGGPSTLAGLSAATTFYDLLRATQEALGREARACYAALGPPPREIRISDAEDPSALAREILGACLEIPVRPLRRTAPAAAGAALAAALALGLYPDPDAAAADWVAPHLGPPLPVDPTLHAVYAAPA